MLRLVGMSHYRGTLPGLLELWQRGEVRDIPTESVAYLLDTFPGVFEAVALPSVVAPSLDAPPTDRMIRSPRRK